MRIVFIIFGCLFFVLGIIGLLTPIPFGLIFMALSIVMLVPTVPQFANMVRRVRVRSSMVDRGLKGVTRRAPMPYRRILRQTEPQDF